MSTRRRDYQAIVSIFCDHGGLRPYFKALEDALYGCLSEIDDARSVRQWMEDQTREMRGERLRLAAIRQALGRVSPSARVRRTPRTSA